MKDVNIRSKAIKLLGETQVQNIMTLDLAMISWL
jgi:hypothetical protein